MELMNKKFLVDNLIKHHYESNKDYFTKINFLYFSEDKKLMSAYWEAPVGYFEQDCSEFDEVNYVIEGEIEITKGHKKMIARKGDCFYLKKGDKIKIKINKPSKTFLFIYPAEKVL